MINTVSVPRLSAGAIAQLEAEIRALQRRHADLTRLAGGEDEAAAYPVRQAIQRAGHELDQAAGLVTLHVGQPEALRRLDRAAAAIAEAASLLQQAGAWEDA